MTSRRPVLAAFLVFGAFWGAWAALVPGVQQAVGLSKGALGLALLCVGLGALPAMWVTGRAIDRFGGVVLPASFVLLAGAALLPAFAATLPTLAVALLMLGAMSGAADVAINAEVAALEAATGARFMALAHALFSLGLIGGALASGLARQAGTGRLGVLAAATVAFLAVALANRRPWPRLAAAAPRRQRVRGRLVALGAVCAVAFVVEGGMENWSALFLERELGAEPAVSALGPAAFALAMVVGRLSGQGLQRRFADRLLLGAGAALSAVGLLAVSRSGGAGGAIAALAVGGAGISLAAPILFAAAGRGAGEAERGSAVATVTTIAYLGFVAGPPLLGGLAEAFGLRASFALLASLAALVALAAQRVEL